MNKKLEEFNNNLIGKKIAIIGLGVSNIPLLDYFKDIDCEVSLFNEKEINIDLSNYNYKLYVGNRRFDRSRCSSCKPFTTNWKTFTSLTNEPQCNSNSLP